MSERKRDQVDFILQGFPKEYNPLVIMIYEKVEPKDIYEVEALLYVQETQMDKYKQVLITSSETTNIAQAGPNQFSARNTGGSGTYQQLRDKARGFRVRGRGRQSYTTRNRITCQLCKKYGHSVIECRHIFNE